MEAYLPHIAGFVLALLAFLVKRLFRTQDLLFTKYDAVKADVDLIKLAIVSVDPTKAVLFRKDDDV